jgi:DNA-binding transcriptional LysR family regulator
VNSSNWANNQQIDDLRLLRCFVTVADELHFGRAAKRLALPQSTVSEAVRQLERVFGHPLFIRTTRRVALSALGEAIVPEARRAIDAVANVYSLGAAGSSSALRPLLLGTAIDIDNGELSTVLPRLRLQHPSLRITPRILRTADQIQALLEQRLHLGFVWEPPEHALLVSHLVGTTGLVAVVPYDHSLARRKAIPIAVLDGQPVVVWSADMNEWTRDRLHAILRDHDVQPRIVVEAHGFDQQVPHILAGVGIGLTAASISAAKQLPGLVHIPIRHRGGFRRMLVWRRDETHPGVAAVLEAIGATNSSRSSP